VIEWAKVEIKKWIEDSEEDGHGLEDTDVMTQFEEVLSRRLFQLLYEEKKQGELQKVAMAEKKVISEKLETLKNQEQSERAPAVACERRQQNPEAFQKDYTHEA
jgi:hypothetical protein